MRLTRDELLRAHTAAMSQTYTEFAPVIFDDSSEDQHRVLFSALPREFQVIQESRVPLLQIPDNIQDRELDPSSFPDFIVLAEFSELEGPVPLATIPNVVNTSPLCLNNFAVHLMSTDYQVNSVGHFKISEDTQVLRKNVFKNIHVFMQYFTLYDIKARGFVRPFCFGYVSKDHIKLDHKLDYLINEFDKMTKVLKQANRSWFAGELEQYLEKLRTAKDSFIQSRTTRKEETGLSGDGQGQDTFTFDPEAQSHISEDDDPDVITLEQIANQYLEIGSILSSVKSFENPELVQELEKLSKFFRQNSSPEFVTLMSKLEIQLLSKQKSIDSLHIPLVHPLKAKGESLRPLTTLGQVGTLHLLWKLFILHKETHTDLIFSMMKELSLDFETHCGHLKEMKRKAKAEAAATTGASPGSNHSNPSNSTHNSSTSSSEPSPKKDEELIPTASGLSYKEEKNLIKHFIRNPEVPLILDKIHTNCPIPRSTTSSTPDKESASYHTVSEQDLDAIIPCSAKIHVHLDADGNSNSVQATGAGPSFSGTNDVPVPRPSISSFISQQSQSSSDPEGSIASMSASTSTSRQALSPSGSGSEKEEIIIRKPWFEYATGGNPGRGGPGHGILKFFRHYPKVAHHIFYSILIGRPIVICGSEEQRSKISRILTALIPFVPPQSRSNSTCWKILRWHRGVLLASHIQQYKLIGLCIPERLIVHDLIHPRDQNAVTILNICYKKSVLLGPAYSGKFLSDFEPEAQIQKNFHASDLSFLVFLGGVLTEIQTKVYLLKSLQEKDKANRKRTNFKELNLKASDIDIIRHLGTLVSGPDQVLQIF